MLENRLIIISLFKKRNACCLKKTHKFWIEVPKAVATAYALDKNNDDTFWAYSISKKMNDVSPAFRKLYHGRFCRLGISV